MPSYRRKRWNHRESPTVQLFSAFFNEGEARAIATHSQLPGRRRQRRWSNASPTIRERTVRSKAVMSTTVAADSRSTWTSRRSRRCCFRALIIKIATKNEPASPSAPLGGWQGLDAEMRWPFCGATSRSAGTGNGQSATWRCQRQLGSMVWMTLSVRAAARLRSLREPSRGTWTQSGRSGNVPTQGSRLHSPFRVNGGANSRREDGPCASYLQRNYSRAER